MPVGQTQYVDSSGAFQYPKVDANGALKVYIDNADAQYLTITPKSTGTPYDVLATDRYLAVTTGSSADYTVNLPASTGLGRLLTIAKMDAGTKHVVIARAGTDTIQGATSKTLTAQYDYIQLVDSAAGVWAVHGVVIT